MQQQKKRSIDKKRCTTCSDFEIQSNVFIRCSASSFYLEKTRRHSSTNFLRNLLTADKQLLWWTRHLLLRHHVNKCPTHTTCWQLKNYGCTKLQLSPHPHPHTSSHRHGNCDQSKQFNPTAPLHYREIVCIFLERKVSWTVTHRNGGCKKCNGQRIRFDGCIVI